MSTNYRDRTIEALADTKERLAKVKARMTFDTHQDAQKWAEVAQLEAHVAKLDKMLAE